MLAAIGQVESGRPDPQTGAMRPSPWTIDAGGVGQFFATKAQAIAAVVALPADGVRSIDVGCMQVQSDGSPGCVRVARSSIRSGFEHDLCSALSQCALSQRWKLAQRDRGLPLRVAGDRGGLSAACAGILATASGGTCRRRPPDLRRQRFDLRCVRFNRSHLRCHSAGTVKGFPRQPPRRRAKVRRQFTASPPVSSPARSFASTWPGSHMPGRLGDRHLPALCPARRLPQLLQPPRRRQLIRLLANHQARGKFG